MLQYVPGESMEVPDILREDIEDVVLCPNCNERVLEVLEEDRSLLTTVQFLDKIQKEFGNLEKMCENGEKLALDEEG